MSTMIVGVYEASKAAGAPEDRAATVLAHSGNQFDKIDAEIGSAKIDLAVLKAELALGKWIISGAGFGVLLLVRKSFWPH